MSVITISRGSFSGGKMLAECLSKTLGYRCVDRDVIVERAAAFGVSQEVLRDALQKAPGFLDRFQHKKYLYLALIQAALAEEVCHGKAVYHGNAGHLLLKGGLHILRVRIIAPVEFRLKMAQDRLKLSRDEALRYIHDVDLERRKWTQYLYGLDWGDPNLYDIVLNLEHMDIREACNSVASLALRKCFEFTPACQSAMNDLALASRVRADLALNRATAHLEFDVASESGAVEIRGKVSNPYEIEEVLRVAEAVPGVVSVNLDRVASPVSA